MAYVFKRITDGDFKIQTFQVNKGWTFTNTSVGVDIQVYNGELNNSSLSVTNPSSSATQNTIYRQVRHLYYGGHPTWARPLGAYDPYYTFGSNSGIRKSLDGDKVTWISIPQLVYGDSIKRGSIKLWDSSGASTVTLTDDKLGNLYDSELSSSMLSAGSSSVQVIRESYVGNVFYEHGNIILTSTGSSHQGAYEGQNFMSSSFELYFQGTHYIDEMSAYVTSEEGEFNFTMNDSTRYRASGNQAHYTDGQLTELLDGYATSSDFAPYVTMIGLYDDYYNLLAVGKLTKPIHNYSDLPITFKIQIDI